MKAIYVVLVITSLLIGGTIGFNYGVYTALTFAVDKAQYFLDMKGTNITIKDKLIASEIWRYRNNIGACP